MPRASQLAGNDRGKNHPRKIHPKAYPFSTRIEDLLGFCDLRERQTQVVVVMGGEERGNGEGPTLLVPVVTVQ